MNFDMAEMLEQQLVLYVIVDYFIGGLSDI